MSAAALFLGVSALDAPAKLFLSPLVPVSRPSPFTNGCGVSPRAVINAGVEPTIDVSPSNHANLVAAYEQDRFRGPNALANVVGVSRDGGLHWRRVFIPGLSRCTGGAPPEVSNPFIAVGPNRTAYLASDGSRIAIAASHDLGRSWSRPVAVDTDPADSQTTITADPRRAGAAYALISRFSSLPVLGLFEGLSEGVYFTATRDAGRTWSVPKLATLPLPPLVPMLQKPIIEPDGSIVAIYTAVNVSEVLLPDQARKLPLQVVAVRSDDGGATWSAPVPAATFPDFGPHDPTDGTLVRAGPFASAACGPDGRIYVAYPDVRSEYDGAIRLTSSRDDGRTWSPPVTVKRVGAQTFLPEVAVDRQGDVAVSYYDLRHDHSGGGLDTDQWLSFRRDGGRAWREVHIAGPFNLSTAVYTPDLGESGLFLGDHEALVGLRSGFGDIFAASRPLAKLGPSSIFFRAVRFGPARPAHHSK